MSRSGYTDDLSADDRWAFIRWRGAVKSALRGKNGQAFLREMLAAFDALPEKKLVAEELVLGDKFCALGAVGRSRQMSMVGIDPEDHEAVSGAFGISSVLARELMYENDERGPETEEQRFERVRRWIEGNIR